MSDALHATRVCLFDAYGTLFDVHSAVARLRSGMNDEAEQLSATWRQKQLEYTWLRSLMQDYTDFEQVTADALDYALAAHPQPDAVALRAGLLEAYTTLSAYPEVPGTLATLHANGWPLGILSNGTVAWLDAAVDGSGLRPWLAELVSVDPLRVFKPAPVVYQTGCDRMRVAAHEVCFLSSNAWDVAGAAHFGYKPVWINRGGQPVERLSGRAEAEIRTLDALLPLLPDTPSE
ncbi:MAG: haloacid dehalogenase type II [Pseudomonadota bacterium]